MSKKIYVASDHAGYKLKSKIISSLVDQGYKVVDLGPETPDRCDYSDYAFKVAEEVQKDSLNNRGILICGSGVGVSMTANRCANIRAALCRTVDDAKLSREHNDSNVLCIGERCTSFDTVLEILQGWLETPFEGGRHEVRVRKFSKIGEHLSYGRFFSSPFEFLMMSVVVILILMGSLLAIFNPGYFEKVYTLEDGFLEWTSAVFLGLSSIICWKRLIDLWGKRSLSFLLCTLVFALLFIFGLGEEISWGQRLFNIESGDFFSSNNTQAEINLHNLKLGGVKINKLIFGKLLGLILVIYFLAIPFAYSKNSKVKSLIDDWGVPLPSNIQIFFYLLLFLLAEVTRHPKRGELLEFGGVCVFFLIMLLPRNKSIFQ